ncbi:MAG: hypothetical protein FRX49_06831 [Trebouxia sp. A1-2]|nr:MAG: hypothetical protein FRX49_06831 [Trebouxia sp. A1-2]
MGSMIHTVDIRDFGSTFGCIGKPRTTIAATCALLIATVVLTPVYLVLSQRQQKVDLRRLASSYQVQQYARATLTHRQWHLNYYHSIAESIWDVYNLACMYFQLCNLHTREDIIPMFLDRPGVAGWDARLGVSQGGWRQVLPPAAEALQCFYPKPALWVADPMLHGKVVVIKTAVAGIGPHNRKWPGPPETADRFRSVYQHVDTRITTQYREGLLQCLGVQPAQFNVSHSPLRLYSTRPYKVTIVNREYHAGRHIVNTEDIAREVNAMEQCLGAGALRLEQSLFEIHAQSRVAQLEDLTFKQQMVVYAESQVVIMTHGAALGNVLFMSPGSVALFYNWLKIGGAPHTWVTDVIQDFALPVNFVGLSTKDRRFIYPQKERYVFQPQYGLLPADEKRALLEEGICPSSSQLQGCEDLKMNFAIDWNLLRPALSMAFLDMQERHSHILDGLDNI